MELQIVEIVIALAALIYGIVEHSKRQKMERVLKTITQSFPGDVAKIDQSCKNASTNVRDAHKAALKLGASPEKDQVLTFINLATNDTGSGSGMCSNLFNQLLGFQEAQFGTRNVTHPDRDTLDLYIKEMKNVS
jgi:hypothetical protein